MVVPITRLFLTLPHSGAPAAPTHLIRLKPPSQKPFVFGGSLSPYQAVEQASSSVSGCPTCPQAKCPQTSHPATQYNTNPQTDRCQSGLWTNQSCQLTWEGEAVLNLPHRAVGGPHWGEGGLALCHLILSRTQLFLGEELALTDLLWYFQTDPVSLCPYSVLGQTARRQQTF